MRSMVRINDRGDVIVSVAVPVQRFRAVRGALMLSTQGAEIDDMVEAERLAILKVVSGRRRRHGRAVDPARRHHRRAGAAARRRRRERAPAHPLARRDSGFHPPARRDRPSLRHAARHDRARSTAASKRSRSFAADVSHELKNPLTSLRSAVETLPVAKTEESRGAAARDHPARRQAARSADLRHFRCQPARCRIAAPGSDAGRSSPSSSRRWSAVANEVKRDDGVRVTLRFEGGGPRAFPVPGHDSRLGQVDRQSDRECALVLAAGGTVRVTCRRLRSKSKSWSTTTARAIATRRARERFSSAFTPTGRIRASARIPDSACRSPNRSSTRMAAPSGSRTGRPRRGRRRSRRSLGARFIVRLPAHDDRRSDASVHASAVLVGVACRADPRTVGRRQIAAGARTDPGRARRASRSPGWSATIASISRQRGGRLLVRPAPRARRPDRSARARHSAAATTSRARSWAWWSILRRRMPSGCRLPDARRSRIDGIELPRICRRDRAAPALPRWSVASADDIDRVSSCLTTPSADCLEGNWLTISAPSYRDRIDRRKASSATAMQQSGRIAKMPSCAGASDGQDEHPFVRCTRDAPAGSFHDWSSACDPRAAGCRVPRGPGTRGGPAGPDRSGHDRSRRRRRGTPQGHHRSGEARRHRRRRRHPDRHVRRHAVQSRHLGA